MSSSVKATRRHCLTTRRGRSRTSSTTPHRCGPIGGQTGVLLTTSTRGSTCGLRSHAASAMVPGTPKTTAETRKILLKGGPAALITWKWHENRYMRALVCRKYTTLGKDLDDLTRYMNTEKTAEDRLNLANWEHARGGYWLHEATHMDYFMNTPSLGSGPVVRDLLVDYSDGRGENKAYGIDNAKKLANYDRHFTPGEYTQQNSDNYRFYAMSKWVEANSFERTYPYKPSVNPFAMPVFPPKVPDEG
ncbi:hypothetical protein BDP67DRAFT_513889 [Colletotrichum lupini]|nr:hypothetical protein BDP67DRAFT_513889 [Colletotrichum lupini]